MTGVIGPAALIVQVAVAWIAAGAGWREPVLRALAAWLLFWSSTIALGLVLSAAGALASPPAWFAGSVVLAGVALAARRAIPPAAGDDPRKSLAEWSAEWGRTGSLRRAAVVLALGGALGTWALALVSLLAAAPHSWDAHSYHLPRIAYYLQQGSLAPFGASFWAQEVHAKGSAIVQLFLFLGFARSEPAFQLAAWSSAPALLVGVFVTARTIGASRMASTIAAGAAGLLTCVVAQSITATNDLPAAALGGAALAFGTRSRRRGSRADALAAALALATFAAVKLTFLVIVPPLATALLIFPGEWGRARRPLIVGALALAIFGTGLALPAGYLDNLRQFGHPAGPERVRRAHSFEGASIDERLRGGAMNIFRYASDFLRLDGLPPNPVTVRLSQTLSFAPLEIGTRLGLNPRGPGARRTGRRVEPVSGQHSWWGPLGALLALPALALALLARFRTRSSLALLAGLAVFVAVQAWIGPYDRFKGRYFMYAVPFAMPIVASVIDRLRGRAVEAALVVVLAVGMACGASTLLFHSHVPLLTHRQAWKDKGGIWLQRTKPSVFALDRLGQIFAEFPSLAPPFRRIETFVPADAVLAVHLHPNHYEYPLFGPGLERRVISLNDFVGGPRPIPAEADLLLYDEGYAGARDSDIPLGKPGFLPRMYLRRLR